MMQLDLTESKFTALQKKALKVYIEGMINMGCKFKVTDPDGEVYQTEQKLTPEKRVIVNKGISTYIATFIDNLLVGQSAKVPLGKFSIDDVQANCNSRANRKFGNGSLSSSRNIAEQYIEVIRIQ
jgi:hypothetical protein